MMSTKINIYGFENKRKNSWLPVGQAVGDALGLGTEFMNSDAIKRNYPEGPSQYGQIIQDRHRKRWNFWGPDRPRLQR